MKLLTFAVPCYNSQDYMDHCIQTLLEGGEDVEIFLVDDGSKDGTGAIADRYAAEHPSIVRVIHQENGGHGEGVNQGIRHATGLYYKVVDSDDWADVDALRKVIEKLREFSRMPEPVDLLVCNYVYEHVADQTRKVIRYANVFPQGRVFTWRRSAGFRPSQYLLMHSVFYRTSTCGTAGWSCPSTPSMWTTSSSTSPCPSSRPSITWTWTSTRYFIGRADQSVNEQVMVRRVDQQVRVTRLMIDAHDLRKVSAQHGGWPVHVQLPGHDDDHLLDLPHHRRQPGGPGQEDPALGVYAHSGQGCLSPDEVPLYQRRGNFPGYQGRKLSVGLYRLARRIYKFN